MKSIPIYALYGEQQQDQGQDWLHWETVHSRSRLHDFSIAPHRHEQFFQLLHLTAGEAAVSVDGEIHRMVPPALIAVPALTVHGYEFSTDIEGVVLTLFERDVQLAIKAAPEIASTFARPLLLQGIAGDSGMTDTVGALHQLIAESDRRARGYGAAMPALLTLLLVAIDRAHLASAQLAEVRRDRAVHHAQAYRALVDRRYRETRSLPDYADALGISATHLNRVSRQVLGASALTVIERRIALEAKRYLRFSSLSVKEIADLLGYSDPAYFTRFCTRSLGMSPGRYRAVAQPESNTVAR